MNHCFVVLSYRWRQGKEGEVCVQKNTTWPEYSISQSNQFIYYKVKMLGRGNGMSLLGDLHMEYWISLLLCIHRCPAALLLTWKML